MLASAKSEVCKALYDRIKNITYGTETIPAFVDIASKTIANDSYIYINGYIDNPAGTKMRFGFDCAVNVEVITCNDNMGKHNSIVNSVKGSIHSKLNDTLQLSNFINTILLTPTQNQLIELNEDGQIIRTILNYKLNVEQKNN